MKFDNRRAESLVMQLIPIPGPSGRESAVAKFITDQLRQSGVPTRSILRDAAHRRSPFGGECGNLIVRLPGSKGREREPRRMLMAHMDTVPLAVGGRPVRKGRVVRPADRKTALGGDNRAGSAALLADLIELMDQRLSHPPLTFLWCVQEEVGLCGARYVDRAKLGAPKLAFNFDGGDPVALTLGATGAYRLNITVRGVAAHAGCHPQRGVSAIAIAGLAIADLQSGGWHGLIQRGGVRGTSNVGVIRGGDATNVVTDELFIRAEARSHNPTLRHRIVAAYRAAFTRAARQVRNEAGRCGRVKFEVTHDYESFALHTDEPCVAVARSAAESVGLPHSYRIADGGLDANWINAHGIPTVTLGCGQHNIHMTSEYLDMDEYLGACHLALELTRAEG